MFRYFEKINFNENTMNNINNTNDTLIANIAYNR